MFFRLNDLVTFQALKAIYMVGTDEEVNLGIRGYFENNLSELDSAFIGRSAKLSSEDARVVDRLCQIMDEDIETDILNEALLSVVRKCGNLEELINAAVVGIERQLPIRGWNGDIIRKVLYLQVPRRAVLRFRTPRNLRGILRAECTPGLRARLELEAPIGSKQAV